MDEVYEIASEFLSIAKYSEDIGDILSNGSRMNVGVDTRTNEVLFTLDDRYIKMDLEYAEFVAGSIFAACETLRALILKEMN
jgi:hypothetical protein